MKDKFAYYDFIANIIPGIICIWLLHFWGIKIFNNQNIIAESILYIVIAYVIGLAIQFFASYIIEFIIKVIFWENAFFSNISLLKGANRIEEELRIEVIDFAKLKLNFNEKQLNFLEDKFTFGFYGKLNYFKKEYRSKIMKAQNISHQIYRRIDAFTKDNNIALKAHEQNNYYSLFRGLSMVFLSYLGFSIYFSINKPFDEKYLYLIAGTSVGFIIFLIRAKQRGELYIKGLFYSISSLSSKTDKLS